MPVENQRWYQRAIYNNPIRAGDAGRGIMGGLDRFFRGAGRETVANTVGEAATGGIVNPVRGVASGLRSAVRGSNWYQDRQDRQGNLGPPSNLAGPGAIPPARNEGFLGRLDNSFESGTNPLAAALGVFTGYGRYGTGEAATNAFNNSSQDQIDRANATMSRGRDGGGAGQGSLSAGADSGNSGTGGNAFSSRWLPVQTGSRLVRRT